jgi:hypothetical protein
MAQAESSKVVQPEYRRVDDIECARRRSLHLLPSRQSQTGSCHYRQAFAWRLFCSDSE